MDSTSVYVVTYFGCNSSGNHMWIPESRVFFKKEDAYAYYHSVAPRLDDEDNRAERIVYKNGEAIKQIHGYLDGDGTCAKRPVGAVIRFLKIT
jgi:hypothetical protein